ncbi:MAG: radical SAM protein [Rhodothermales bacterium]
MRTVSININKRCPLKCKHCSIGFSEDFKGEDLHLTQEDLAGLIRSVDPDVYDVILMAGGEPSLSPHLIRAGIEACDEAGLLSAIVSAPVWASRMASADRFLDRVKGLDLLILSYDAYHLEFLTLEHYRHAAMSAVQHGIKLVFEIAYTREEEKESLITQLGGMKVLATHIYPMRTVSVGNAVHSVLDAEEVTVQDAADLDRIPRGCVLGNVFIDDDAALHGCCWSTAVEASPFSVPATDGAASLPEAFNRLEASPLFQKMRRRGFLDGLTEEGRRAVAREVEGERYATECDLCMRMMRTELKSFWKASF